jgi:hypothetical protein
LSKLSRALGVCLVLLALTAVLFPSAALAHERRTVAGKYQFVVGFLNEPAVAGQMNGIDLRVSTADAKPVEGVEQTLKAEVIVGGGAKTAPLALQARFGQPGSYAAYFIPTRDGSYIFHFTGTIEGTPIDERFESGPGRFNDVQAAQPLQFPDKLPDPAVAAADAQAAREEAATARLIGIAGLIVGALGLAAGGTALLTRRAGQREGAARGAQQS